MFIWSDLCCYCNSCDHILRDSPLPPDEVAEYTPEYSRINTPGMGIIVETGDVQSIGFMKASNQTVLCKIILLVPHSN